MSNTPTQPGDDQSMSTTTIVLLVTAALTTLCYLIYDNLFAYKDRWSKYGVKQPRTNPFGFLDFRTEFHKLLEEYGDNVGLWRPNAGLNLLTRDTKLLKQIMVKDFNNFVDRGTSFFSKSPLSSSVFFAQGSSWKRLRHMTSPSFSTGKLKLIGKTIEESAQRLTDFFVICAKSGQLVPLKKITGQYTSEIIARTAFGFKTSGIGGEDDEFTKYSKQLFKIRGKFFVSLTLAIRAVPGLLKFLVQTLKVEFFEPVAQDSYEYFLSVLGKTIPERKNYEKSGSKKPSDFLQMMVSAQLTNNDAAKSLTDEEMIGQAMLIVFAGFETTASSLQMILYLLAQHPDIQEKVYQEIQSVVKSETPTHEELTELKYVEQVINETLRFFPVVPVVTREAKETRTYGDITIPAKTIITIDIHSILRDAKHYPDPEKFDPDRFSEEAKANRDPLAFMAFGYGPRLCIGQRLAYLELKTALVHVLRKVVFQLNDKTEPKAGGNVKLSFQGLLRPEKPIEIACVLRE